MTQKRFEKALFIQQGACNPSGIAHSLVEACKECLDEGVSQREDPAVRLIVHQLAYLCNVQDPMDMDEYRKLINMCEDKRVEKDLTESIVKVVDEKGVYPNALDAAIAEQAEYYGDTKQLIKTTLAHIGNMKDAEFSGFHQAKGYHNFFEVHLVEGTVPTAEEPIMPGWYWRTVNEDRSPKGDDHGPFPTAEGAYLDAIEE